VSIIEGFVLAVKAVTQNYFPISEMLLLLEEFRKMVNDCIRIGLAEHVTSKQTLCKKAYHQLDRYKVPTYYRLTAVSKAVGILRNYRITLKKHPDAKKPYASRLMLTDCYAFRIVDNYLRLPIKPRRYIFIPLNRHTLTVISGYTARSVTLTASTVSISFSKETAVTEPTGLIGIDRNVDNVTTATLDGKTNVYDLSEVTQIKATYRMVKSHFKRNDTRIGKRIFMKYGTKQRNRVNQRLHRVSKAIVEQAVANKQAIIMENLKGIRKLYRKGNGQGKDYRSRLNSWSYYELQRQIEYKAKWEGISIIYVHAAKTSSTCAICGCELAECGERKVYCPRCIRVVDRDENAALNIVKRGVRFAPDGLARNEAVRGNPEGVILRAEASKSTLTKS
jgi:putative transposase